MAADSIHRHMATTWASEGHPAASRFAFRMKEAVELANAEIYAYAREHPEVRGMGTTVTAAGIFGGDLYLAQIGDSRAYLIRGNEAIQLTKDQSLMQRLVDAGELTEVEAEQSERRNIILQALGPDPRVKVDLTHQPVRRGDTLILCSDGLSGLVRREEFAELAQQHLDPQALCAALIDLANERGGPDNITVITARFEGDGLPEAAGEDDVGYQSYRISSPTNQQESEDTSNPPSGEDAGSIALDRLRNLGLIMLLIGVVMLLLAVWR
jgi:PPM family protein phosphatase